MININLLPWREERKKILQMQFYTFLGFSLALVLSVVFFWQMIVQTKIDERLAQNILLKNEIVQLDGKIASIKDLKEQKAKVLRRIRTVQHLQDNRARTVRLLESIAEAVPEGLFLQELTRHDDKIILEGNASSNSQVAQFMRNIEATEELESPILSVIQADEDNLGNMIEFNLQAVQSGFVLDIDE
jgi:type IV pilus assembly protein PilN